MTHIHIRRVTFFNPIGTCHACRKYTRVYHEEFHREPAFCHECLGSVWATPPDPIRFADICRSYQCHEVARFIEQFQPHTINPDSSRLHP